MDYIFSMQHIIYCCLGINWFWMMFLSSILQTMFCLLNLSKSSLSLISEVQTFSNTLELLLCHCQPNLHQNWTSKYNDL